MAGQPAASQLSQSLQKSCTQLSWVQLVWSEQAGQAPSVYCPWLMPG
jgi:hypothetical protein